VFLYGGIPRKGSSPDEAHRARDDVYGKETPLIKGAIKKWETEKCFSKNCLPFDASSRACGFPMKRLLPARDPLIEGAMAT
jgi:hypothetical protein